MNPDPDMTDEEWEASVTCAIIRNHPGKDCPCNYCLIRFPS